MGSAGRFLARARSSAVSLAARVEATRRSTSRTLVRYSSSFARSAALTCPGKTVKSLHVLFPKEGRAEEPVRYEVERHHEGGTFATLTIIARQSAGVIATAAVSMHKTEDGPAQQARPERP